MWTRRISSAWALFVDSSCFACSSARRRKSSSNSLALRANRFGVRRGAVSLGQLLLLRLHEQDQPLDVKVDLGCQSWAARA
jgi:hypothetical protein